MSHSGLRAALLALLLAGTMLLLAYLQSGPSDQSGTAVSPEAAAALSAPVSPAPKPASESTPVPSSEPASEPAPEPTSKPAPEPTPDLPQELPESWFDDALFLGDSLTGSLSTYILRNGGLGNASFVYVNGLGCHHITRDGTMIPIMGLCLPIEEAVEISGCGKLFLMLAMNDVGTEPIDELRASWETVLDRILERNPAVKVYVQSGTPILQNVSYFTRENMEAYNLMLQEVCESRGCVYVDVTSGLVNEDGFLINGLQKGNVHMNESGCAIWVENLRNPASYTPPLGWEDLS